MRTASVLAWALLPSLAWAAPAAADKDDKPVDQVRKALDQPVTVHTGGLTLPAVMEDLGKQAKINIAIDVPAFRRQVGLLPSEIKFVRGIEIARSDMKLRDALRSVLPQYDFSYVVLGDTVLVTTEDAATMRQMRQRVNVDLSKVELAAALRQLGRDTATNLIVDARAEKEAKVEVSLELEDVPLETAVRLLAEMAGLKPVRVGNTLFVTRKELAAEMRNDPDFAQPNPPVVIYREPPPVIGVGFGFGYHRGW